MKTFRKLLTVAVLGGLMTTAYSADKVLKVASWLPTTHDINAELWPTVKKELEKRTDGRVSLEVEYGLAPPNGLLELIEYESADISWTFNGYFPGRFTTTKMIELPGYPGSSEAASYAHWKAHEKFFKKAGEYEGVKLIGLMVHAPADLLMNDKSKIQSLGELKGRKMRTAGGVANEVAQALKVSPILAPASKSYEMISGGMADGTFLPMGTVALFRLYEVAPNAYTVPGGFYRGSFSIFMSPSALDGVSEADKKTINEYFGEKLSVDGGKVWDKLYQGGAEKFTKHGKITPLAEADVKQFTEMTQSIKDKVIKEVSAKGIDGQAAYDFIYETMKNYKPADAKADK
ncbi:MAG: C4-dicarboxylate ABC transporter substrate-binding protein [Gammaproteobacteria bacterium]|nr:MAG: C4-dicarboxylate ABC transporter substrate-binding protein [Gammaproteobacteria bacterium]